MTLMGPSAKPRVMANDAKGTGDRGTGASAMVLRELRGDDRESFFASVEEFRQSEPDWSFAFHFDPTGDFDAYARQVSNWKRGRDMPTEFVPNTYVVSVIDGRIVGRLSLRHELNDSLRREGGHVGYGVVASERRKGFATQMLRLSLPLAREVGLDRILVTCDDDNAGSRRTIEKCGGVLQDVIPAERRRATRRYWIAL